MPLKIAKPKPFSLEDLRGTRNRAYVPGDSLRWRRERLIRAESRIPKSPHKSVILPYIIRGLLDHREGKKLTKLQRQLVLPLVHAGLGKQALRRFQALPAAAVNALDNRFFKENLSSEVDKCLNSQLIDAVKAVTNEIKTSASPIKEYVMRGGFRDTVISTASGMTMKNLMDSMGLSMGDCPPVYQLRLEYRGIITHKVSDRGASGADPYLITAFYRIPFEILDPMRRRVIPSIVHEMSSPMKVKHLPEQLPAIGTGWFPSGGGQDSQGNPTDPIQFHPKFLRAGAVSIPIIDPPIEVPVMVRQNTTIDLAPLLRGQDLHFAVISAWEEDDDQSAQVMRALTASVGPIVQGLLDKVFSSGIVPDVSTVITLVNIAVEFAHLFTAGGDEHVGDHVIVFTEHDLQDEGYREISRRVKSDEGNEWTLFFGVESRKIR